MTVDMIQILLLTCLFACHHKPAKNKLASNFKLFHHLLRFFFQIHYFVPSENQTYFLGNKKKRIKPPFINFSPHFSK